MHARRAIVLAVLALAAAGCSAATEPEAPPVHDTSDHAPAPAEDTPYARAVAAFPARGSAGAEEAWAAGRPALLVFAASW